MSENQHWYAGKKSKGESFDFQKALIAGIGEGKIKFTIERIIPKAEKQKSKDGSGDK